MVTPKNGPIASDKKGYQVNIIFLFLHKMLWVLVRSASGVFLISP